MTLRLGDTLIAGAGANKDLSNLTSQGENIANWSSNVTNCITEIPQDIKLELNNGTLTLKAGSKVYVPNGAGVFDVVTISSDLTASTSGTASKLLFYNRTTNALDHWNTWDCKSGTSWSGVEGVFYNTSTNTIKYTVNSGSTWNAEYSLPIGIATTDGGFTSIDQVFNGFGYIGSTDFILPNVKCIETLGKNPDGSYITRVFTNTEVRIVTLDSSISGNYWVGFNTLIDGSFDYFGTYLNENVISETQPSYNNVTWFNPLDGKWNYVNDGLAQLGGAWQYAIKTVSNGKITNWKLINNTFKALNYWDKPTISGWSMPSSRYIDLTLGASESTYTAPANGWFSLNLVMVGVNTYVALVNTSRNFYRVFQWCDSGGQEAGILLPVCKGDIVQLSYNTSLTAESWTAGFRFIYSEGEAN